jgi:hypothetical protein
MLRITQQKQGFSYCTDSKRLLITIMAMHPYAGIIRIRFIGYSLSLAI